MISHAKNHTNILFYAMLDISIILISAFPIFGSNGWIVQRIITWITIIMLLFKAIYSKSIRINRYILSYYIYLLFCVVSSLWAWRLGGVYSTVINMLPTVLYSSVLFFECNSYVDIKRYLDLYLLGVVVISFYSLILDASTFSYWSNLGKVVFEKSGQNQIYYSCVLIYSVMYAFYQAVTCSGKSRKIYILVTVFLYMCCLLTAIRKCLIIPIVFMCVYLNLKYKKNILKIIIFIFIGIIFLVIGYRSIIEYVPSMSYRMDSLFQDILSGTEGSIDGNSYSLRKWLRQYALQLFKERPLLGIGAGQFKYYAAQFGVSLYSHNNFLEVLCNTGVIGFFIYYGAIISVLIKAIRSLDTKEQVLKNYLEFVISFILAILIMEYGQVDYYQQHFIFYMVLFSKMVKTKEYVIKA